ISTVALVLSAGTFYLANVRVHHSLQIALIRSAITYRTDKCDLPIDLVFINNGNRAETLIYAQPVAKGGGAIECNQSVSALAIKAGDVIPFHINFHLTQGDF